MTEDVSLSGFLCTCTADMPVDSVVEVYLTTVRTTLTSARRRLFIRTQRPLPFATIGFRFIEKTGPWVLN